MASKHTICLWYDAARFYAETDRRWDAVIGNGGQASQLEERTMVAMSDPQVDG
jgi:hypothetical protein